MGFGRLSAAAVLGQPLSLPIPLRLEPGERLEPQCVFAEVLAGDTAIHHERVRVRIEQGATAANWLARITTTVPIDEPVLDITLTVGCEQRFSRRFVAFADPPSGRNASIAPETLAAPSTGAVPLVANEAGPAAEVPATPRRSAGSGRAARENAAASATQARAKNRPHEAGQADQTGRAAKSARAAEKAAERFAKAAEKAARKSARAAASRAAAEGEGARLVLDSEGPRLKLDMEEPVFMPPADQVAIASSGPTLDGVATAGSDTERLRELEKALADLKQESQAGREAAVALRMRLAESENRNRAVPWLAALVVLSLGVAVWLGKLLRRQQREASEAPHWWASEGEAADAKEALEPEPVAEEPVLDELPDEPHRPDPVKRPDHVKRTEAADTSPLPAALALERDLPAHPSTITSRTPATMPAITLRPEPVHERTMVISAPPPFVLAEKPPSEPVTREVSVEELLDLEQQADFFIALGQEEAAIDLLMAHLRSTGGLSPLPYTKLLEIYRRQGDRDAYERIRTRFNRRFNAYAPEWEDGPLSGRSLEDYPEVVQHLQMLWPEPIDSMAMLEAMLFRKDVAYQLFDLPAYKDVLVLYALARDLWQQGGSRASGVDVLLPLGDDAAAQEVPATVEPALAPTEAPHFEMTAFALPPQDAAAPDEGAGPADGEPTLDPARRRPG